MISQVPRNLKFGNAGDIELLRQWEGLDIINQQLLHDIEMPALAAYNVYIINQNNDYEVWYHPVDGQEPRVKEVMSVKGVRKAIEEFELEHRVFQS